MNNDYSLDFIGIGSGKSGSTWLYKNIVKHPEIYEGNPKEINYFSSLYKKKDFEWYKSNFTGSGNLKKGEFSVTYIDDPKSAKNIKLVFPNIKIIAILRNPNDRIYSDYLHSIRKGTISPALTFSNFISDENNLNFANYYEKLLKYYEIFNENQILVLILEELESNMIENMRMVYDFIGVDNLEFIPDNLEKKENTATNYHALWIENILTSFSNGMNNRGYTRFIENIKRMGIPKLIRKFNSSNKPINKIDNGSNEILSKYYKKSNQQLELLLKREISQWH